MKDEENYYFFDKEELEEIFRLICSVQSHIFSFSKLEVISYDDIKKWAKIDAENYLKNIIDSKNKSGEFVPKSDFYAIVNSKVK